MKRDYGGKEKETRRELNARFSQPPGPEPTPPDVVAHVWHWFLTLNERRKNGESGPMPISYAEIEAWSRLTRSRAKPEEIQMIVAMDNAFLSESALEAEDLMERHRRRSGPSKRR